MTDTDDWHAYQKLVLNEIQRLNKNIESIVVEQRRIHEDIAVLKYKASLFGMIGGLGISSITFILDRISKH